MCVRRNTVNLIQVNCSLEQHHGSDCGTPLKGINDGGFNPLIRTSWREKNNGTTYYLAFPQIVDRETVTSISGWICSITSRYLHKIEAVNLAFHNLSKKLRSLLHYHLFVPVCQLVRWSQLIGVLFYFSIMYKVNVPRVALSLWNTTLIWSYRYWNCLIYSLGLGSY